MRRKEPPELHGVLLPQEGTLLHWRRLPVARCDGQVQYAFLSMPQYDEAEGPAVEGDEEEIRPRGEIGGDTLVKGAGPLYLDQGT